MEKESSKAGEMPAPQQYPDCDGKAHSSISFFVFVGLFFFFFGFILFACLALFYFGIGSCYAAPRTGNPRQTGLELEADFLL